MLSPKRDTDAASEPPAATYVPSLTTCIPSSSLLLYCYHHRDALTQHVCLRPFKPHNHTQSIKKKNILVPPLHRLPHPSLTVSHHPFIFIPVQSTTNQDADPAYGHPHLRRSRAHIPLDISLCEDLFLGLFGLRSCSTSMSAYMGSRVVWSGSLNVRLGCFAQNISLAFWCYVRI
ncbi:hypothetical protein BDW22DRAFT_1359810 [Trametopsis cervina]|nr:hypothetical protein BDW22DRAFT_1359810 [Trametopsis cervina]